VWTEFFNMVSAANNAIEQMPLYAAEQKTEANKALARQYASEAKVIRAYAYWQLTRMFGSVPLVDRSMSAEELGNNPQVPLDRLYDFMYEDLQEAINLLPDTYGKNWGCRYNKYTAMALKAKVALYRGDWKEAAKQADAIISSGRYRLMDDFRYVFGYTSRGLELEYRLRLMGLEVGMDLSEI
jgi:hypothetical protein